MANGDDKKTNLPAGQHSGYTGYQDNLGGAQYYQGEVDEGGGSYYVSGERPATRTVGTKVDDQTLFNQFNNKTNIAEGFNPNWTGPSDPNYRAWLTKIEEKRGYRGKKDKQTYKQTSANNVSNTKNNNADNGNTGPINITNTATGGAGGSVGNVNVGTGTGASTGTQTQQKTTKQPGTPGSTLGVRDGNTSQKPSSGGTRGYSGNSPFNQATASATGGSVGDITINVPGGGDGAATPDPKANITGQNSPLGGGASGLISDIIGGGSGLGVRKTQGGDPTQPGGPTARRGGSTPYQMRSLQNQFQSWAMNHYNNPNNTT